MHPLRKLRESGKPTPGRVERFRNRDQGDAALLEDFQQAAEVLHGPREPVEFGNNHRLDFAAVHQS